MNKDLLKKLVKEILTEATEADMKKLRRAVILSIFSSDIPNVIKRDLNSALSSAPDADVRKITKVFLTQVLKDDETLSASSEYQELKQDPEFQKLANNINQKIALNNKAGLLDLSNVAFTTSDISKPFSYSTLLYYAVEREAQALLRYLTQKYGKNFSKESLLVQMNRTELGNIKISEDKDKWDVVYGVISHFNPNDIKFYVETWNSGSAEGKAYFDTIMNLEKKFDVPINWIPSPTILKAIIDALSKK